MKEKSLDLRTKYPNACLCEINAVGVDEKDFVIVIKAQTQAQSDEAARTICNTHNILLEAKGVA